MSDCSSELVLILKGTEAAGGPVKRDQSLIPNVFHLTVIFFHVRRHLPLSERKEILDDVLPEDLPLIAKVLSIKGNGKALFDLGMLKK